MIWMVVVLLVGMLVLSRLVFVLIQRQHQTQEDVKLLLDSVHVLCVHTGLASPLEDHASGPGDAHD